MAIRDRGKNLRPEDQRSTGIKPEFYLGYAAKEVAPVDLKSARFGSKLQRGVFSEDFERQVALLGVHLQKVAEEKDFIFSSAVGSPTSDKIYSSALEKNFAQEFIARLHSLGSEPLRLYREFGGKILDVKVENAYNSQALLGGNFAVLIDEQGHQYALSKSALLALAKVFFDARKAAIQDFQSTATDAEKIMAKSFGFVEKYYEQFDFKDLPAVLLAEQVVGAVLFCQELARLSAKDYRELKSSFLEQNPEFLQLSFSVSKGQLAPKSASRKSFSKIHPGVSVVIKKEIIVDEEKARHAQNKIESAIEKLEYAMLSREEQVLLPKYFNTAEYYSGSEEVFDNSLSSLSAVRQSRENYLAALRHVCSAYFLSLANTSVEFDESNLESVLKNQVGKELAGVLSSLKEDYEQTISSLVDSLDMTKSSQGGTKHISSLQDFVAHFPDIRRIIEGAKVEGQSPANTGILNDYYDAEYWEEFFNSSARLLLRYNSENEVVGFFAYYLPGKIPENHTQVPERYRGNSAVAYAELIVTAEGRPPGTYQALFRGMLANLQLTEAKTAEGLMYSWNTRSAKALQHFSFVPHLNHLQGTGDEQMLAMSVPIRSEDRVVLRGLISLIPDFSDLISEEVL